MEGRRTWELVAKPGEGECGFWAGVVFVDTDKDVFRAQEVDELEEVFAPDTADHFMLDYVGCDEYLFVVGIAAAGDCGGSYSI
jgi:hypothetical protein